MTSELVILFGGESRERLVSTASAQAVSAALPQAALWFWDEEGVVFVVSAEALARHERPFEITFQPDGTRIGTVAQALDRAAADGLCLVLGLHGGSAENGEFQVQAEARHVAFTGSGSAASHLAFDKISAKRFAALCGLNAPGTVAIDDIDAAFAIYGGLVAKPSQDGSSFGLIFARKPEDLVAVRRAAHERPYLIEPLIEGIESTCGVLEQADGSLIALPPVEILPADGAFDYHGKYLAAGTREICPGRFDEVTTRTLQDAALIAHRAMSCRGYSRSDFIVTPDGPVYIETNTLPGLTRASLYPKSLKAQGIGFADFLEGQVIIAQSRLTARSG